MPIGRIFAQSGHLADNDCLSLGTLSSRFSVPGFGAAPESQRPDQRVQLGHPEREPIFCRQVRLPGLQRGGHRLQRPSVPRRQM
jgi:hypothetical protein